MSIQAHLPSGTMYQQAAAWELLVASIILAAMIVFRFVFRKTYHSFEYKGAGGFLSSGMTENSLAHTVLYFILFALVFSATMSFFV